jgi:hypothetical protein
MIIQFFVENTSQADLMVRLGMLGLVASAATLYCQSKKTGRLAIMRSLPAILAGYAIVQILFNIYLWFNHINFSLNLEAMELLRLQHLKRLMSGFLLYPEPSSDFIALAYNPLSYILTVPFAIFLGDTLFTMRLVAILGMAGSGLVIFLVVRQHTASHWWSLMATGLFAAAYRTMDCYLDTAHTDSWLLLMLLLGCYQLDRPPSRWGDHAALLLFILAFWFKQQGGIFAVAAIAYLTWRHGWRQAWTFWLMAALLGVGLYVGMPDGILGPRFHYFTWQVPRQWLKFTFSETRHLVVLMGSSYPLLGVAGSVSLLARWRRSGRFAQPHIWNFMFPVALLSGVLAACTPGSNNNVYIPLGTWLIIIGTLGLHHWMATTTKLRGGHLLALSLSFALLAYNPLAVLVPPSADAYQALVNYVNALPGTVYAPWLGALPESNRLSPTLHWVPLDDIFRGTRLDPKDPQAPPPIEVLLQPVLAPPGTAYILHNKPLDQDARLSQWQDRYLLEQDLGPRFQALSTLPRRYQLDYPRYLYRYVAQSGIEDLIK